MPIVEHSEHNRPSFSSEIMTGLAKYHRLRQQMLFILGGAGGFRVGEELGIEIDKHMSSDCSTITIVQKARRGRVENRVKTLEHSWKDADPDIPILKQAKAEFAKLQ